MLNPVVSIIRNPGPILNAYSVVDHGLRRITLVPTLGVIRSKLLGPFRQISKKHRTCRRDPRSSDWGFILSKFCNIIIHVYLTLINMFIILQNYAKFSSNYTTSMSIQLNGNYSIFYIAVFGRRIYLPIGMNFGKLHRVSVIFPFWGIWVCRQFMQTFLWRSV